jgi:hypothetical protein
MKYTRTLSRIAVCAIAAAAWLMATLPASAVMDVGQATVTQASGNATVSHSGSPASAITTGMTLTAGDTINTGPGSTVVLNLGRSGGMLSIQPGSQLTLTKLDLIGGDAAETELFLAKGAVGGKAKKVAGASKYEIKTASSVAGIRGTDFFMTADGTVTVLSGTVLVVYVFPDGSRTQPVAVVGGQSVSAPPAPAPGGTPVTPTPTASTSIQLGNAQTAIVSINTGPSGPGPGPGPAAGSTIITVVIPPVLYHDTSASASSSTSTTQPPPPSTD